MIIAALIILIGLILLVVGIVLAVRDYRRKRKLDYFPREWL